MQVIIMITLSVLFIFFMFSPDTVLTSAQAGLSLWWNVLIPSLLPFFIINHLLTATGSLSLFGNILKRPFHKLFRLPREVAFLLLAGYTTGAPLVARLIRELRKQNIICRRQANILLPATANVSPGFCFPPLPSPYCIMKPGAFICS